MSGDLRSLDAPGKLELVYLGIDLHKIQEAKREEILAVAKPFYTLFDRIPRSSDRRYGRGFSRFFLQQESSSSMRRLVSVPRDV